MFFVFTVERSSAERKNKLEEKNATARPTTKEREGEATGRKAETQKTRRRKTRKIQLLRLNFVEKVLFFSSEFLKSEFRLACCVFRGIFNYGIFT